MSLDLGSVFVPLKSITLPANSVCSRMRNRYSCVRRDSVKMTAFCWSVAPPWLLLRLGGGREAAPQGGQQAPRPWSSWRWTWPGRGTRGAWPSPAASRRAARACSCGRSGSPLVLFVRLPFVGQFVDLFPVVGQFFRRGVHGFSAWAAAVSSLFARPSSVSEMA